MRVHVVAPAGFRDVPSGGNIYDRRACAGLAELGWDVRVATVAGPWPEPDSRARTGLANVLTAIPDGETVLIDGLIASPSADPLLVHARRLRVTVLLHMPLATAEPYGGATAEPPGGATAEPPGGATAEPPGGATAEPPGGATAERAVPDSERAVLGAAAGVIVTSGWTRRQVLARYDVPAGRVHVARPGVDPAGVVPPNGTDPPYGHLLCVAALAPHKGQDVLVEALAGLAPPGWTCVLAGPLDREPGYVAELRVRVAQTGLGDRIRFTGTLTGAALDHAYASAGLLVVPSRTETYGMVVTEALARGIPVIATTAGGLPEALGDASCGLGREVVGPDVGLDEGLGGGRAGVLVPPGDPGALRDALAAWLADPSYRRRLRTAARHRRSALTGWDRTARDLAAALTAR